MDIFSHLFVEKFQFVFEKTKKMKNRSGLVNFFEKPLPNSLVVQKLWRVFWRVAGSQPTHPGDVKNAEQLEWRQTYWERYQCSKKVTDRQCDQIAKRISKNLTIYKIKKSAQQLFFAKAGWFLCPKTKPSKISKYFKNLPKVAHFCHIWSHCSDRRSSKTNKN